MSPLILFILLYLLLNYTFVAIQYFLYPRSINFIDFNKKHLSFNERMMHGLKVFKFIVDLAILFIVAILFKNIIPQYFIILFLFISIVILFTYTLYNFSIKRIYNTPPNFTLDSKLLRLGVDVVFYGYRLYLILAIIGLTAFFTGLYFYLEYLIDTLFSIENNIYILVGLSIITLVGILTILSDKSIWNHENKAFYSISFLILGNIKHSFEAKKMLIRLKSQSKDNKDDAITNFSLKEKPNIIFLFLESYGAILYDKFPDQYQQLIKGLEKKLDKKGWKSISNLSKAPRSGGGSWLCYSSFLYGISIEHEVIFRHLVTDGNQEDINPSLLGILKREGYQNHLISPLTGFKNLKINWQEIKDFMSLEDVVKYEDLNFEGNLTGFLGRQPPDQFSLNKGYEIIKEKSEGKPFAIFFETLNSHANWLSPTLVENDYEKVNDKNYQYPTTGPGEESYYPAMEYQIAMAIDFVHSKLDDNSVMFIIGDHQPPLITEEDSGNETPIHIISKDENILEHFKEYGFEDGLMVNNRNNNNLTHPGAYYAIIRSIIKAYADEGTILPEYLEKGVEIR